MACPTTHEDLAPSSTLIPPPSSSHWEVNGQPLTYQPSQQLYDGQTPCLLSNLLTVTETIFHNWEVHHVDYVVKAIELVHNCFSLLKSVICRLSYLPSMVFIQGHSPRSISHVSASYPQTVGSTIFTFIE